MNLFRLVVVTETVVSYRSTKYWAALETLECSILYDCTFKSVPLVNNPVHTSISKEVNMIHVWAMRE